MLFNSFEFALFLLALAALVPFFPRGRPRHALLLAASYVFYGSWSWPFLGLLWATTLLDFACGLWIGRARTLGARRAFFVASLIANLGVLAYFKYGNFFFENVAFMSGVDMTPFYLQIAIPLGISFYTFHSMTYTIDVYRGRIAPCTSLLDFALYVTFFPQLIAGPIMRAAEFLPQLARREPVRDDEIVQGVELFLVGLFKKVVIADNLGLVADQVFGAPSGYGAAAIAIATAAFWIQVYCDFSGYSTMAQGLALGFGFRLPQNFDYPMLRTNPVEYRRAWHVTMGRWFTDYVYQPLGGSRVGDLTLVRNILITWTLTGLWHGASWHFVFWGFYNGVNLAVYSLILRHSPWRLPAFPGRDLLAWLGQVALLLPSAALFRAPDLPTFLEMLGKVARFSPGESVAWEWALGILALTALHALCFWKYDENLLNRVGWPARIALVTGLALLIALFAGTGRPFIYFQF